MSNETITKARRLVRNAREAARMKLVQRELQVADEILDGGALEVMTEAGARHVPALHLAGGVQFLPEDRAEVAALVVQLRELAAAPGSSPLVARAALYLVPIAGGEHAVARASAEAENAR